MNRFILIALIILVSFIPIHGQEQFQRQKEISALAYWGPTFLRNQFQRPIEFKQSSNNSQKSDPLTTLKLIGAVIPITIPVPTITIAPIGNIPVEITIEVRESIPIVSATQDVSPERFAKFLVKIKELTPVDRAKSLRLQDQPCK